VNIWTDDRLDEIQNFIGEKHSNTAGSGSAAHPFPRAADRRQAASFFSKMLF